MRRVMNGEKPDRTPVMCQLSMGHIYLHADLPPEEYWFSPHGQAEGYIRMAERYGFDGILVSKAGADPDTLNQVDHVAPYQDGRLIVWKDARRTYCPPDEYPRDLTEAERPNPCWKSIDDFDPDAIPIVESGTAFAPWAFNVLDEVLARKGNELSVHGEVGTAFEGFLMQLGALEAGLMALIDDPARCHVAMQRINRGVIARALAQCARGVDAMKFSSPIAGAGFISRAQYEEFVLPYEEAVIAAVHRQFGIPCYIHTCGAIGDRLALMARTGADGLECLDPPPLGTVDLAQAVAAIGETLFIKGNLDSVHELLSKTPTEVQAIARERIRIGGQARGYILSTACSVAPRVPPENILVLRQVVEE